MRASELDNFVVKFKQLWKSGEDAHLHVHTHAGNAWVGLHVQLGQEPQVHHHVRSRDTPSRQWRRAKQAKARQNAGEAIEAEQAVEAE